MLVVLVCVNNFWISGQILLNSVWTQYFLGCYVESLLRALEKLRKATTAFIMSVCLLVCIEQFDSHWKDVMKFEIFIFFEKPSRKFKFY